MRSYALCVQNEPRKPYPDACRQVHNNLIREAASVVSDSDAKELFDKVTGFRRSVEEWLSANHPTLI